MDRITRGGSLKKSANSVPRIQLLKEDSVNMRVHNLTGFTKVYVKTVIGETFGWNLLSSLCKHIQCGRLWNCPQFGINETK